MLRLISLTAVAATLALAATSASATTYALVIPPGATTTTSFSTSTLHDYNTTGASGLFTDDFTFTLTGDYGSDIGATFKEQALSTTEVITAADLSLFKVGSSTPLETTGMTSLPSSGPTALEVDDSLLTAGDYYFEAAMEIPAGDSSAYYVGADFSPVSQAPEPRTWALMLAGVGLVGVALRSRRIARPIVAV